MVYASDTLYYTAEALREADVVICSRSGETAEIVALARRLNNMGIPYIVALTNEPESTLAHTASHIVWTDTRKDDLVSINVVTGMMAGALALAAAALGEADTLRPDLKGAAAQMPAVIERAAADTPEIMALLEPARADPPAVARPRHAARRYAAGWYWRKWRAHPPSRSMRQSSGRGRMRWWTTVSPQRSSCRSVSRARATGRWPRRSPGWAAAC